MNDKRSKRRSIARHLECSRHDRTTTLAVLLFCGVLISPQLAAAQDKTPREQPLVVVRSVQPPDMAGIGQRYGVTRRDFEAIGQILSDIELIVPVREVQQTGRYGSQYVDLMLSGTTPDYARLHHLSLKKGRFLNENDLQQLRNVAVIGSRVARQLFGFKDPLDKIVRIGRDHFVVVGVLETDEVRETDIRDLSQHVFIPLSTMHSRLGDRELSRQTGTYSLREFELSRIVITTSQIAELPRTATLVEQILDHLHDNHSYSVTYSGTNHREAKE